MIVNNLISSLSSRWTSAQMGVRDHAAAVLEHIKRLEKPPQGNVGIWEKYSTSIAQTWSKVQQSPTPHTILDFLSTITYLKETSKDMSLASLTLVSTIAKSSLKKVADTFFTLCPLPLPVTTSTAGSFDHRALMAIAGCVTIESLASSCVQNTHLEKKLDFTTMGTVVGTTMSWLFDQNLYVGAISGTIMGGVTGLLTPLLDPILVPVQNTLSDLYIKSKAKQTLFALPPTVFFASAAYIANQSPESEWPSVFAISLIPSLTTWYTLFYKSAASQKIVSKAYKHLAPIAWIGYTSMALSLAFQQAIKVLEAKLDN